MRAIQFDRNGPPSVLQVVQRPDPTPGPGQVRVRVAASGVNFADVMARIGVYQDAPPLPSVVGYEVSGTIDAVGDGVDEARIGEAVVAMTRFGGYADTLVLDAIQASTIPEGVDVVDAAAIPVTGLTAWMILHILGRVRAGDRVLVLGAGGGVGLMALDLIKEAGAEAWGAASPGKHAWLADRGWDALVDYRQDGWAEALAARTEGFDLVLDPVGGRSWGTSLDLLRPGGRLVAYGMSANAVGERRNLLAVIRNVLAIPWLRMMPVALINENKGVLGVNMGRLWDEGPRVRGWLDEVLARVADGRIRPDIHARVPFDQAAEAHRILQDRENRGKVLLVP